MYRVVVAPIVSDILLGYADRFAIDNGLECATNFVEAFDETVDSLKELPQRGVNKLRYIPACYHMIPLWKHLWLVYQINEADKKVYIDYLIDDRSDYGRLFK